MALRLEEVFFHYPASPRPAVAGVSLTLHPGERVLLLGTNGSGKSTLVRLMAGLVRPQRGRVAVDGLNTADPTRRAALRRRVGLMFQHPENQIVAQTVADEVAFGLENQHAPPAYIQAKVAQTLERAGLSALAQRSPLALSGGQLQRLALAGLLALDPRYLLVDEPFSWLDLEAQADLVEELLGLKARGCALVIVSQETDLLDQVERVWLMRRGELIADTSPQALAERPERFARAGLEPPALARLSHRLRELGLEGPLPLSVPGAVDRLRAHVHPQPVPKAQAPGDRAVEPLLEADGLGFTFNPQLPRERWVFAGLDLRLRRGEWLVLAGPSGSGKSTLVQLFNGLLRPLAGELRWRGRSIRGTPLAQLCQRAGLVFQNPRQQFFADTAQEELVFAARERGLLSEGKVTKLCQALDLAPELLARPPLSLSGGERLKLALGSVLALEPELLVLDETLTSLDPPARGEVLALLGRLNEGGLTLVTVTHRPAALLPRARRAAWLQDGTLRTGGPEVIPRSWWPEVAQVAQALFGRPTFAVEELFDRIQASWRG